MSAFDERALGMPSELFIISPKVCRIKNYGTFLLQFIDLIDETFWQTILNTYLRIFVFDYFVWNMKTLTRSLAFCLYWNWGILYFHLENYRMWSYHVKMDEFGYIVEKRLRVVFDSIIIYWSKCFKGEVSCQSKDVDTLLLQFLQKHILKHWWACFWLLY